MSLKDTLINVMDWPLKEICLLLGIKMGLFILIVLGLHWNKNLAMEYCWRIHHVLMWLI